jgi:hypothetical protein
MKLLRRDFLKGCAGSAAVLGLNFSVLGNIDKVLAASGYRHAPTYPIAPDIYTTLDRTVIILPQGPREVLPCQIARYAPNHYGEWNGQGDGFPYLRPEMRVSGNVEPSVADPEATPLLSFFTMSDVHISDKESPAQVNYGCGSFETTRNRGLHTRAIL